MNQLPMNVEKALNYAINYWAEKLKEIAEKKGIPLSDEQLKGFVDDYTRMLSSELSQQLAYVKNYGDPLDRAQAFLYPNISGNSKKDFQFEDVMKSNDIAVTITSKDVDPIYLKVTGDGKCYRVQIGNEKQFESVFDGGEQPKQTMQEKIKQAREIAFAGNFKNFTGMDIKYAPESYLTRMREEHPEWYEGAKSAQDMTFESYAKQFSFKEPNGGNPNSGGNSGAGGTFGR